MQANLLVLLHLFKYVSTIMNLFIMVAFGLANAGVIIIGNEIGANREDEAISASKRYHHYRSRISIVLAIVLALLTKPIVSFFNRIS